MDKYEYKLRLEEIKTLNRKGRFQEAAQVADTIDWTKVQNISTLGIISDVYKINRRFEDSKDILLLANEKSPHNRRVIYALCDLTVKMGQVVEAVEYYKEFVQLAPNDNSKYILLYKIYEAQDISLEERIAVLKEYKKREYNEKWAYELAFLYHRVGLATECVEECDQLILWFGEGRYVAKAMELKMLYVPLSPAQQQAYDSQFGRKTEKSAEKQQVEKPVRAEEQKLPAQSSESENQEEELDIQIKPMDMGKYNTINLQAALAESMKEVLEPAQTEQEAAGRPSFGETVQEPAGQPVYTQTARNPAGQPAAGAQPETGMRQMHPAVQPGYGSDDAEYQEDVSRVMHASANWDAQATGQLETVGREENADYGADREPLDQQPRKMQQGPREASSQAAAYAQQEQGRSMQPGEMENLLAQEYDGQISLALQESRAVEKQITGQMNIEDVLAEWERLKRENEEKRKRETRQWMLQQTGSLFQDFDQISRDGILEKLQREEALPAETVQRDRVEDPSVITEVEELEELEGIEELPEWEGASSHSQESQPVPVQPQPAYAQQPVQPQPAYVQAPQAEQPVYAPAQPTLVTPQPMPPQAEQAAYTQNGPVQQPVQTTSQPLWQAPVQAQPEQPVYEQSQGIPPMPPAQSQPNIEAVAGNSEALHTKISEQQLEEHVRSMTKEEKALFAPFVPTRGAMRQLVRALDMISLSAFTGNMIITGAPGSNMMKLAKNVVREVRASDQNFSGKIAKISGDVLNTRSADAIIAKIPNGALIVEKAGKLSDEGTENLVKALNQEHTGILVFLLDEKRAMGRVLDRSPQLMACFNARFDIAALDSGTLVKYGCQYAYNMEYSIDELGRLALHTRIEDLQTTTHAVTIEEVRDIVDEAIDHANKKTLGHFMDILFRKRYDEDDMIVLGERDFI